MNEKQNHLEEISVRTILNKIKDGLLDAKTLTKEARQSCVEILVFEGLQISAIAQLLKKSDKTIRRDLKEIKERNALAPDVKFAKETIGDFLQKAINHHSYLMRLARSKDATIQERVQAEFAAWKVLDGLLSRLQSLGYLPLKPPEVITDLYHHTDADEEPSPEEMRKMLLRIEESAREAGVLDKEVREKIETIKERIKQSEITYEIRQLEEKTKNKKEESHEKEE